MDTQAQFSRFGELPTEIRLKIWILAAQEPRTVHIKCQKESYQHGSGTRFFAKAFTSPTPPPAVLHVCRESRHETLPEYELAFATKHSPARIYVAFERDTIRFASIVLQYLFPPELESLRFMALDITDYAYFAHYNMAILTAMPNLKCLELRASEDEENTWRRSILRTLTDDFDEARAAFLKKGKMPNIRIMSEKTGEELVALMEDGHWTKAFALPWPSQAPVSDTDEHI